MSIFKKHNTNADRSASDRRRHKEKIEKAIKDGIHDIVAEESIIGQSGKKKIKIPVRGIKEYRFIFDQGNGSKGVGAAPGKDIKKGQKIKDGKKQKGKGRPDKPGNEKGDDSYDVEISLDELAKYLFDDLELPELEKKKSAELFSEKFKRKGYRKKGIRPRLSKKETLKNKIKRKNAAIRNKTHDPSEDERFTFHEDDLKYKHIAVTKKPITSAVIFFIMDTSGSMTKRKKYLARSFFFLLYQFIRYRYQNIETVFISHTTEAVEVNEDDFFKKGSSGGTYISSGLKMAYEITKDRYPPGTWNIYTFHCSDGENWQEDNPKALEYMSKLVDLSQLSGYIQIKAEQDKIWGQEMAKIFSPLVSDSFKVVNISGKKDVWPEFARLFGGKYELQ